MDNWIKKLNFRSLALVSVALLIFALIYNLSYAVLIGDECIRSLVAFEMLHSGNFFVPTINGDYYYHKPPIYNWFIAFSYYLFGYVNEFSARFPTVIFSLAFGFIIYFVNKKYFGKQFGFLVALLFLTCGRILFWDSMLALIDIAYSMLVYIQIYLVFYYFNKNKIWELFLITYLLTAIGFLMKGYPSLAFQAVSVGLWFIYKGQFKQLFSIKHILGIVVFSIIIASYYWIYGQYHEVQNTISPLLSQATKRTLFEYDFLDVIKHFFSYPFENLYHFLPWSVFSILLIRKDVISKIKLNAFIEFNALMFIANIAIYWLSPEVFPRYILMLVPFFFTVLLYFYFYQNDKEIQKKVMSYLFKGLVVILPFAMVGALFIHSSHEIAYARIIAGGLFILMSWLAYVYFKRRDLRIILFILMLIVTRISFDVFVLHARKYYSSKTILKCEAERIGTIFKKEDFHIYKNSRMYYMDSYYIASKRGIPLHREQQEFNDQSFYILDPTQYNLEQFEKIDSFMSWEFQRTMYVVKILEPSLHEVPKE